MLLTNLSDQQPGYDDKIRITSYNVCYTKLLRVDSSFTDNIHDIVTDADMYVYSVKDSVLPALIEQINVPDAIHIHTAGSVSATVFSAKYSNYGVIYPLQTLSKSKAVDFGTVPLLIEASNETTRAELSARNNFV